MATRGNRRFRTGAGVRLAVRRSERRMAQYELGLGAEEIIEGEEDVLCLLLGKLPARVRAKIEATRAGRQGRHLQQLELSLPSLPLHTERPSVQAGKCQMTSFHFEWVAISKTRAAAIHESGLVVRPGAALGHANYVEREEAVARLPSVHEVAECRAEDVPASSASSAQAIYIERQEAQAVDDQGAPLVFSNISGNRAERIEVWDLIEQHERTPSPDQISLNIGDAPEFWAGIRASRRCPPDLVRALASAAPTGRLTFKTDHGKQIMAWLRQQAGWNEDLPQAHARFGEGGRIQFRIVGELPNELPLAERSAIVNSFCGEFEKRGLPYTAVIHAPDHNNDARNWHFHLVYYDRPITKMADGRWDFAAAETYRADGHQRVRYPWRQKKVKEVNHFSWAGVLRRRFAEINNEVLIRNGATRRLHPGKYRDIGISRPPTQHLGSAAAALEKQGVATLPGVQNAITIWSAAARQHREQRAADLKAIRTQASVWRKQANAAIPVVPARFQALERIDAWQQSAEFACEYAFGAAMLATQRQRLEARATRVINDCNKSLDAVDAGTASRVTLKRQGKLHQRRLQARIHLQNVTMTFAREAALAAEWERLTAANTAVAGEIRSEVEAFLAKNGNFRPITPIRPRVAPEEVDAWIEDIIASNRRLTVDGEIVVPVTPRQGDQLIIASGAAASVASRMKGLMRTQADQINQVRRFVSANPHLVKQVDGESGSHTVLEADTKRMVELHARWRGEPEIEAADRAALAISRERSEWAQAAHRALNRLAETPIRIVNEGELFQPKAGPEELLTPIARMLDDEHVQRRLRGFHAAQQASFKTLSDIARQRPRYLEERNGAVVLAMYPRNLKASIDLWRDEPEWRAELRIIAEEHAKERAALIGQVRAWSWAVSKESTASGEAIRFSTPSGKWNQCWSRHEHHDEVRAAAFQVIKRKETEFAQAVGVLIEDVHIGKATLQKVAPHQGSVGTNATLHVAGDAWDKLPKNWTKEQASLVKNLLHEAAEQVERQAAQAALKAAEAGKSGAVQGGGLAQAMQAAIGAERGEASVTSTGPTDALRASGAATTADTSKLATVSQGGAGRAIEAPTASAATIDAGVDDGADDRATGGPITACALEDPYAWVKKMSQVSEQELGSRLEDSSERVEEQDSSAQGSTASIEGEQVARSSGTLGHELSNALAKSLKGWRQVTPTEYER